MDMKYSLPDKLLHASASACGCEVTQLTEEG